MSVGFCLLGTECTLARVKIVLLMPGLGMVVTEKKMRRFCVVFPKYDLRCRVFGRLNRVLSLRTARGVIQV